MERKVLGKGLEALIPSDAQVPKEKILTLKVSQIEPSPFQPRLTFSQEKIEELAQSIREKGIIQPVIVRAVGGDRYELIAGERRLRAVQHLGLEEIPAILRRVSDSDVLELSIIENIQREELHPLEEAKAYKRLVQEFGFTQETIAGRVGKDKSSISNLLRILNLPEKIQDYLSQNLITFGHARALLALVDQKHQMAFCGRIVKHGLSVRQTELLAAGKANRSKKPKIGVADPHIQDLQDRLRHALGTKVRIHHGKKRGRLEIEYYSLEDLQRLLRLLTAGG
ncbi:MAG: ParB/RepB/Spo0J family partition protein [Candidatus Omnitrophica bacterium]|nr:ParB/RepB/Spo0J family partition protein [Candidatus Omnitrophota bacterium]